MIFNNVWLIFFFLMKARDFSFLIFIYFQVSILTITFDGNVTKLSEDAIPFDVW